MPYRLICGCKGTAFFQTSKFFVNFFYDFFNLFFKWLRINRDLQENLGETPRCRRGASCAGKNGRGRCLSWERVVVGFGGGIGRLGKLIY